MHAIPLILSLFLPQSAVADDGWVEAQLRRHGGFEPLLEAAEELRLQVLVSEVVGEGDGRRLVRHGFRVDAEYFYPASSIKTFAALAALDLVEREPCLELDTPLVYHPLFADEVLEDADESHVAGGTITVGHEVRKLSIVSDNRAFNRLYELVGHEPLHRYLRDCGWSSVRLAHRLSEVRSREENLRTPRVEARCAAEPVVFPERTSRLLLDNADLPGTEIGRAHVVGEELVEGPMSFRFKNAVSLVELQDMLVALVAPDLPLGGKRFGLDEADRAFLLEAMSIVPRESLDPRYDPDHYPDDYVKFLLPGLVRRAPAARWRIVNKVGLAYGFGIENAYVEDRESGRGLFVSAVIYTNPNGVLNDGVYAYDEQGFPFFADLGEVVAGLLLGTGDERR